MWRQRRWRFLLNLIDHLPTSSFFVEACADDEEAATALLASKDGDVEPRGPRLAEWTPERDELVRLCDRIGELIAITVQLHGQQLKVPPRPRPVTALDRARAGRRRAAHDSLVRRLLPPPS